MEVDKLIIVYHNMGLNQQEILNYLAILHDTIISKSTLKRKLRHMNLYRKKMYSDIIEVALFVQKELETSGKLHGYRWMHLKCIQSGFNVPRDTVYELLKLLDPAGVQLRKRCRLKRRQYVSKGPNYVWHIDSYDKLKPYGIEINGCIDGFSRNLIWVEANTTNSDPKVVAHYYIEAVKSKLGCPQRLRADMGTENSHVEQMQKFLRRNHNDELSGDKSFVYGQSTHNQRIEWFWGILRKEMGQFYMDLFSEMRREENNLFCGDMLDKSLIQFCFMNLIQRDLDSLIVSWNTHVLQSKPGELIRGKRPISLYSLPQLYGVEDRLCKVDANEVDICEEETVRKPEVPCDETVRDLCAIVMEDKHLNMPSDAHEAKRLYIKLRKSIASELESI